MINLYWPVYKNLEKEVLELSNQVHFDDKQLSIYSVKIAELLIRCSVEIEAISKDLFFKIGGTEPTDSDLYFDTHCLQLLEDNWFLSKKKIMISAPNIYFQQEENRVLAPLLKANKRGTCSCDWKKAYQAVKHNRTLNLEKGNIKNLLRSLGALFILNIYFKDEVYNYEKDSKATNFPINMGSDIFSIKLHKCYGYDSNHVYKKKEDFDEYIYFIKFTDDSHEKYRQDIDEIKFKQIELFSEHPKYLKYSETNNVKDYNGQNLMRDLLNREEYFNIIRVAAQNLSKESFSFEYEAVLNKNTI